ncbi:MAG: hypothetical protein OEV40_10160 [Acidimicrobiia bacterium]|nr:hypothetical protein [Acidimicrobiia bacterium]
MLDRTVDELLDASGLVDSMRSEIAAGAVYVVPSGIDRALLVELRAYLTRVGQSSLPSYHRIEVGAPNSHRMNDGDERSYVRGRFHQFSFYPWNQDLFGLFDLLGPAYRVKNLLSGLPPASFLGRMPEQGCTARISVQFYPRGGGGLNRHTDPVDRHQLTVPTLELSHRGDDYATGGIYVIRADGSTLDVQEHLDVGDVLFFNAATPHGVATIDHADALAWHRFEGRWIALLAVNKLQSTADIGDSVDLG